MAQLGDWPKSAHRSTSEIFSCFIGLILRQVLLKRVFPYSYVLCIIRIPTGCMLPAIARHHAHCTVTKSVAKPVSRTQSIKRRVSPTASGRTRHLEGEAMSNDTAQCALRSMDRYLELHHRTWEIDGDLYRCRHCNAGQLASKCGEKFVHASDCGV